MTPKASQYPRSTAFQMIFPNHSPHDYRHLVRRWRAIARKAGLEMSAFAKESDYDVFLLRSKTLEKNGGLYISAGIHGDEPAATEALVEWAGNHAGKIGKLPLLIFPCLNPWGLENNSRRDERGRDLNRVFQHDEACAIGKLKRIIKPHRFALALTLHEDYDARGVYIYELERQRPFWGEALLGAARPFLPADPRTRIEGRRAVRGLVRRKINPAVFRKIGFPEAIYLHQHHSERTFTIETPSEAALDLRISAHAAILDAAAGLCHFVV